MEAISFSVSRFMMGGVAMLFVFYLQNYIRGRKSEHTFKLLPAVDRSDWPRLLVVSIFGATLAPWLGIEGLGLTHGSRASLWLALGPALSCGTGLLFSTEQIGKWGFFGIALAAIGTVILTYDGLFVTGNYWTGDLLLLTALLLTVIELHLIKPLAGKYGSVSMVALRTVVGGSVYLLISMPSLIGENWLTFGFWTWFAILAGGAIGVGVGQWVKVRALDSIGPTRVVIYGNLVPVAAMAIAWLSVGQNPDYFEIAAGIFIIAGAYFIEILDGQSRKTSVSADSSVSS